METLSGTEMFVRSALEAGAAFCSGYPITPATALLESFALAAVTDPGLTYFNAEDEIAAIYAAFGASLGGKKSFVATSGPGFSLMQEGVGYGFAASIPVVIVDVMRQGPSTGMPTKASQGDVLQTQNGSHGDYCCPVFVPFSVSGIRAVTHAAFNVAELAQTPVVVLMDAILANLYETVDNCAAGAPEFVGHDIRIAGALPNRCSGLITDDAGNPSSERFSVYDDWMNKRLGRIAQSLESYGCFEYDGEPEGDAEVLVVSYGTVSRFVPRSGSYDRLVVVRIFPFVDAMAAVMSNYRRIIAVEMNRGQYASVLRSVLMREVESIPVSVDDLRSGKLQRLLDEKLN